MIYLTDEEQAAIAELAPSTRLNILRAHVDWNLEYANYPDLKVEVRKLPNTNAFRFRAHEARGHTFYWAEYDGFVRYFVHDHRNSEGFGGRVFNITMESGEKREIKGPWSSRAGVLNSVFPPCVDVTAYTPGDFTGVATAMTLPLATYAAMIAGVPLIRVPSEKECSDRDWDAMRKLEFMGIEMTAELPSPDIGTSWAIPGKYCICHNNRYHYIATSVNRLW